MRELPENIDRETRLREERLQNLGGMAAAAKAIGLEDHRNMLVAARKRINHSYAAMAKAAGFKPPENADDEVGDLSVTGDQTYNFAERPKSGMPHWLAAAIIGGAGVVAGAAATRADSTGGMSAAGSVADSPAQASAPAVSNAAADRINTETVDCCMAENCSISSGHQTERSCTWERSFTRAASASSA